MSMYMDMQQEPSPGKAPPNHASKKINRKAFFCCILSKYALPLASEFAEIRVKK
jgi:hypothetical protein